MIINDTRPWKCGKCGSDKINREYIDIAIYAICQKCGHKGLIEICPKEKKKKYRDYDFKMYQSESHRKF